MSKIIPLKVIDLSNLGGIDSAMDESICNLENLRYFEFRETLIITNTSIVPAMDIPDCIENNWINLQYIELFFALEKSYVSPSLYNLPNIGTIVLTLWPFNVSSFENFTNYNEKTLKQGNNTYVWFGSSTICEYQTSETGFQTRWLDYVAKTSNNSELLKFIQDFNPCDEPCGNDILGGAQECTSAEWGNGICNVECFNKGCSWDNGDCTQLCHCWTNSTLSQLLLNDKCDLECNTTYCEYDNQACLDLTGTCMSSGVDSWDDSINITRLFGDYNYSEIKCYNAWILDNDLWCDDYCRYFAECNYDLDICSTCQGHCNSIYELFRRAADKDILTNELWCDNWPTVVAVLPVVDELFQNCNASFEDIDKNKNTLVGFREVVEGLLALNILSWQDNYDHVLKFKQINCSMCVSGGNLTLYNL